MSLLKVIVALLLDKNSVNFNLCICLKTKDDRNRDSFDGKKCSKSFIFVFTDPTPFGQRLRVQLPHIPVKFSTQWLNMHIHFQRSPITAGRNWRVAHHSATHSRNHHKIIHKRSLLICYSLQIIVTSAPLRHFKFYFCF